MVYTKRGGQNKRRELGRAGMFLIVVSLCGRAGAAQSAQESRVRSSNAVILASLSEGVERSATFAGLVDAIARSNGIVYVEFGYCAFGHLNGCLLPFLAPSEHARYLRIVVTPDKTRQSHDQLLALVGHEMQHAREVLDDPKVDDLPAMQLLYRKIGTPIAGPQGGFETTAARTAEDAISSELSRTRRFAARDTQAALRPAGHR
jgi:hypothetical protein